MQFVDFRFEDIDSLLVDAHAMGVVLAFNLKIVIDSNFLFNINTYMSNNIYKTNKSNTVTIQDKF